jgi:hypothetical protein
MRRLGTAWDHGKCLICTGRAGRLNGHQATHRCRTYHTVQACADVTDFPAPAGLIRLHLRAGRTTRQPQLNWLRDGRLMREVARLVEESENEDRVET